MAEHGGGRAGKDFFSDFSLKILWFSLRTSQKSSDKMNGLEELFIEKG